MSTKWSEWSCPDSNLLGWLLFLSTGSVIGHQWNTCKKDIGILKDKKEAAIHRPGSSMPFDNPSQYSSQLVLAMWTPTRLLTCHPLPRMTLTMPVRPHASGMPPLSRALFTPHNVRHSPHSSKDSPRSGMVVNADGPESESIYLPNWR